MGLPPSCPSLVCTASQVWTRVRWHVLAWPGTLPCGRVRPRKPRGTRFQCRMLDRLPVAGVPRAARAAGYALLTGCEMWPSAWPHMAAVSSLSPLPPLAQGGLCSEGVCASGPWAVLPAPAARSGLSPQVENLLLSSQGTVKLCDFGSATTVCHYPDYSWTAQKRALVEEEVSGRAHGRGGALGSALQSGWRSRCVLSSRLWTRALPCRSGHSRSAARPPVNGVRLPRSCSQAQP